MTVWMTLCANLKIFWWENMLNSKTVQLCIDTSGICLPPNQIGGQLGPDRQAELM